MRIQVEIIYEEIDCFLDQGTVFTNFYISFAVEWLSFYVNICPAKAFISHMSKKFIIYKLVKISANIIIADWKKNVIFCPQECEVKLNELKTYLEWCGNPEKAHTRWVSEWVFICHY